MQGQPNAVAGRALESRRGLSGYLQRFTSGFWSFFAAAFFFDFGFGLFFFLFPLYLTDLRFNERLIGQITACMTLGNVAGTVPAMLLARRRGLRPLLLFTFLCAPALCALRVLLLWVPAQFALAFATGIAMCCWPICFSPTIAALTDERNRTSGFSIMFATGIGMGTLAGVLGGYVPEMLHTGRFHASIVAGIRSVLLLACIITIAGAWPLRRVRVSAAPPPDSGRVRLFHPFLLRFLPPFLLWNVVTGSFPVFGAIYLQKALGIPLGRLGVIFSASQLLQFTAVIVSPLLYRHAGVTRGIAVALGGTAVFLALLGGTGGVNWAVAFYLAYNAMQFMCGPGIYNLLMSRVPEAERSTASAIQNLSGAVCQAGTAAVTGIAIVSAGYRPVLFANAACALGAALLFLVMPSPLARYQPYGGDAASRDKDAMPCPRSPSIDSIAYKEA